MTDCSSPMHTIPQREQLRLVFEELDRDPAVRIIVVRAEGEHFSSGGYIKGFTEAVQKMGVEIVDSIDELLPKVDVVFLESVDGRPHLSQARPVLKAGKRLFIDKPFCAMVFQIRFHIQRPRLKCR